MNAFWSVVRRDLLIAIRRKTEVLTIVFFFVIVTSLFPLGIGADPALLRKIAPGVIWVAALLSTMLGLQKMFQTDYQDGGLEQMVISSNSLTMMVLGKIWVHWLTSSLPLIVIAPVLGIQFDLDFSSLMIMLYALLLGTPALSLIGAIGAALTLGIRGGSVLLSLLVLPLYIPVLIFGAGAVYADIAGLSIEGYMSILGALLVLSLFFSPFVAAAAIKVAVE